MEKLCIRCIFLPFTLEECGKKIVKTRGIDGGLKKSEYILWENEHPEIFSDGMETMLKQYNADQHYESPTNQRHLRELNNELIG